MQSAHFPTVSSSIHDFSRSHTIGIDPYHHKLHQIDERLRSHATQRLYVVHKQDIDECKRSVLQFLAFLSLNKTSLCYLDLIERHSQNYSQTCLECSL